MTPAARRPHDTTARAPRAGRLARRAVRALALVVAVLSAGCGGGEAPRSLVVITLDTLRADHVGCYGYPLPTTPGLDELAARGVVFERAYAPMPQTLPSHATLFTGLPPRRHGALENAYVMRAGLTTLAQRLADAGHETAAVIGARILDDTTGIQAGFDLFDLPTGVARDEQHPVERRADAVTDTALSWALTRHVSGKPYFLWAHYYDIHGPWEPARVRIPAADVRPVVQARKEFAGLPPKGSAETLGLDQVVTMWHGYDNEIAEVDAQVTRLLRGLAQRGMLDDAVVLVVGDHGEGLMEHDEKGHGVNVFEELMQVPLLVVLPDGAAAGTRVRTALQLEDVLPTLLSLLGAAPAEGVPGRDVSADVLAGKDPPPRPVFVERPHYSPGGERYRRATTHGWGFGELVGVVEGRDKLVRYPDGSVQLFDLEADPDELHDRAAEHADTARRLGGLLDAWLASMPVREFGEHDPISAERAAVLEALGYTGTTGGEAPAPAGGAAGSGAAGGAGGDGH